MNATHKGVSIEEKEIAKINCATITSWMSEIFSHPLQYWCGLRVGVLIDTANGVLHSRQKYKNYLDICYLAEQ